MGGVGGERKKRIKDDSKDFHLTHFGVAIYCRGSRFGGWGRIRHLAVAIFGLRSLLDVQMGRACRQLGT